MAREALYWIAPNRPQAVEWKHPPKDVGPVRALLEEWLGLVPVDRTALEVHVSREWRDET